VELVFHGHAVSWGVQIIRGVEAVAGPARVGMVLSELGGERRRWQQWLDDALTRRPLGVILVPLDLDDDQRGQLESRSIPFVVVDTAGALSPGVPTVGSANWNGGLVATRHRVELGHRRIAIISGPAELLSTRARIDGYRSALDHAGIPTDPALLRHGDFLVDGGYHHGLDLLSGPDRPTAIFAGSDLQALGVLRAARQLGLRVAEDLSVVGYDDLPVSSWIGPALTTVRQPLHEMAATATRILLDLADGTVPANSRIDLATELVVRESTAAPPTPPPASPTAADARAHGTV
jgi:DNA-binding LacI/PurR family transcriptional regulator